MNLKYLEKCDGFEWDDANAPKNWDKHRVTPTECEESFFNRPLIVADDEAHSQQEKRYFSLGRTNAGRRLFVVFTIRGTRIRVISARDTSRRERKVYDDADEEDT